MYPIHTEFLRLLSSRRGLNQRVTKLLARYQASSGQVQNKPIVILKKRMALMAHHIVTAASVLIDHLLHYR